MLRTPVCRLFSAALAALLLAPVAAHADPWITPTPEELSMTSQPEVPGAAAVYLNRDEVTDDKLHAFIIYARIKVLTEKGKEFANVELPYVKESDGSGISVTSIEGRTIHADGTIIPFTGKPYDKLIEKGKDHKYMAKVFSLPDVQVGSIVEYRYQRQLDDHWFQAPSWYIQSDLFTRKAHYIWRPTNEQLIDSRHGGLTSAIAWAPVLPKGTEVKMTKTPDTGLQQGQRTLELTATNVPPMPEEDHMAPVHSLSYRVLFYYTAYTTTQEYWKSEGKDWSKMHDKFIGPGKHVKEFTQQLVAPGDTSEQKLRKMYAAVEELENTDYTRQRSATEEKREGLRRIESADDVLTDKRGSSDQLNDLFVAMARAAGFKAYVAAIADRGKRVFNINFLSLGQLDDDIAIVNVDGKEQYFDPGTRYMPYGHLSWHHGGSSGLRQVDGGTERADPPSESYAFSHVQRLADLTLDEAGVAKGSVTLVFTGEPAVTWRHQLLAGDETSLKEKLKESMEEMLPEGAEVTVTSIANATAYEQPLTISYRISTPVGSAAGKRVLVPSDIFLVKERPSFTQEKRETMIYFEYPEYTQDACRFHYPAAWAMESAPAELRSLYQKSMLYHIHSTPATGFVTVQRDMLMGDFLYPTEEYPQIRTYFSQFETKDQEPIIFKVGGSTAAGGN
ncbi:MAG: DUF3857 and transglutaminase domain-containing protein [Acidobacteriota bacterium]|nr:DUF3857 and transglutaminase domain-containing protein [Acidobacteriota bacterium]